MDLINKNIDEFKEKCSVFGVGFVPTTPDAAVLYIKKHVRRLGGEYICFSNVHTTVIAADVPVYRKMLNSAAFVFPDGAPVAAYMRKHGFEGARRVAGLKENLEKKYPGLDVQCH